MKVTFFLPSSLDKNKTGPILEHVKYALEKKYEVNLLICNRAIRTCSVNQLGNPLICFACVNNFKRLLKQFNFLDEVRIIQLDSIKTNFNTDDVNAKTLKEFQDLYWDGNKLDVGWSIVSTFVSSTRDISNNINNKSVKRLKRNYYDCLTVYENFKIYLDNYKPDKVIVFNGRMFDTRAILRASQSLNVNCDVLEISAMKGRNWNIYPNSLPHDLDMYTKKLNNTWDNASKVIDKHKIGSLFYELRKAGSNTNDKSHVEKQDDALLPENFNKSKLNIVIFNSSEDEIFSIGPEWKKKYETQKDGIIAISKILNENKNYHIYLRIHPNLTRVKSTFLTDLNELDSYNNITVIPAESPISSYKLLDFSDKIITFGSTIGVEATFWGKPSLALSDCFYLNIQGAYNGFNFSLKDFLFTDNLPPKEKINALKYGFYQMTAGKEFKYWKKDFFENTKIPKPNVFEKILYHFYNNLNA